jgi:hypothetical protein
VCCAQAGCQHAYEEKVKAETNKQQPNAMRKEHVCSCRKATQSKHPLYYKARAHWLLRYSIMPAMCNAMDYYTARVEKTRQLTKPPVLA